MLTEPSTNQVRRGQKGSGPGREGASGESVAWLVFVVLVCSRRSKRGGRRRPRPSEATQGYKAAFAGKAPGRHVSPEPFTAGSGMAAVQEQESETQLCSNCKKEIPLANFTMHEVHCKRNIAVCPVCKEAFPKSEMSAHREEEHTQAICKCGKKTERGYLEEHMASECPLRPMTCQHCDIELAFNKLQEHEDYCGARTERCHRCGRNIMLKELKGHPENCEELAEAARISQAKPRLNSEAVLQNIHTIHNLFRSDGPVASLSKMGRFPENRLYNCLSGEQVPREISKRNVAELRPDQNRVPLPFGGEPDCNLDYLLALSLQRENSCQEERTRETSREPRKNLLPTRTEQDVNLVDAEDPGIFSYDLQALADAQNKPKAEILLPCEFCEELFPEEDLILHQTGCSPASALESFSKRSAFLPPAEHFQELLEQMHSGQSVGRREGQHSTCGSLMLPCEFCGVQLEEEILFHHQDQCDLRPPTAPSGERAPAAHEALAAEKAERRGSPDLPRRRVRHQGEISSQYLEEFQQQQAPAWPPRGSPSYRNPAVARRIQLTPPQTVRTEQEKPKALGGGAGGRKPTWDRSEPAAASLPPRRPPPRNTLASGYAPGGLPEDPARPSPRGVGCRNPAARNQFSKTKVKPQHAEPDCPDTE